MSTNQVRLGNETGETNMGTNTIAIGTRAGMNNQHNNTVIINASGVALNSTQASSTYIKPIKEETNTAGLKALFYDTSSSEIIYHDLPHSGLANVCMKKTTQQTMTSNNTTINNYTAYEANNSGSYITSDLATGLFTINATGIYLVQYNVVGNVHTSANNGAYVSVNGNTSTKRAFSGFSNRGASSSVILTLNSGDTVSIKCEITATSYISYTTYAYKETNFAITKIY